MSISNFLFCEIETNSCAFSDNNLYRRSSIISPALLNVSSDATEDAVIQNNNFDNLLNLRMIIYYSYKI
jgi:hypothetical protein